MFIPFAPSDLFILTLAVMMAIPALLIAAVVDHARHPRSAWAATDQNHAVWFFVIVLVVVVGPVLYLLVARPRLLAAGSRGYRPFHDDVFELERRAPQLTH